MAGPDAHTDDDRLVVDLSHQADYRVPASWVRDQMGDHESDIDEVVRAYISAVEDGEHKLPAGHVEFAALQFSVEIPASDDQAVA